MITSSYRPAAGRYLISEPFMNDENFQRSVVFLVEHGEQGSLGFVINRKLKVSINEVVSQFPVVDAPVFMGGPVEQNTLHYIHRLGDKISGSRKVCDDIFWGGSFEEIQSYASQGILNDDEILFFIGYSGWAPGQLNHELEKKSWIVATEDPAFIFETDPQETWRDILKRMGSKYQIISNYPIDPRLN